MRFAATFSIVMACAYAFAAFVAWDALWLFHMGELTAKDRGEIAFAIVAAVLVAALFALMIEAGS